MKNTEPITYEIRQVDVWGNKEDGYTYNQTWRIGTFTTAEQDARRAFRRALARLGVTFKPYSTVAVDDGTVIEIIDRATGAPLFAAIPEEV